MVVDEYHHLSERILREGENYRSPPSDGPFQVLWNPRACLDPCSAAIEDSDSYWELSRSALSGDSYWELSRSAIGDRNSYWGAVSIGAQRRRSL